LTRGHAVNLYHVWQEHGEAFDLEGELVSSAVIKTTRSVVAVTGVHRNVLVRAKLNTNIEWDVWRIRYLGKVHSRDVIDQEDLARIGTIPAKPNSTVLGYGPSCQDYSVESSHEPQCISITSIRLISMRHVSPQTGLHS
jgi:hypothetical protein